MLSNARVEPTKRPTQRDQQKAETRARVIEAARSLFVERGYEAATIRDIAQRAGVAPGSVFTTFASKADLLQEIIYSKYASFYPTLAALARKQGTVEARLIEMGEKAYAFEFGELRLVAETMGASWTWTAESEKQNRERLGMVLAHKVEIVTQGVKNGELSADTDVKLVVDALFSCYLRNFRRALFEGWDVDRLSKHFARQVKLVLGGCRA
jgi:AcrR family transcriptional regulator